MATETVVTSATVPKGQEVGGKLKTGFKYWYESLIAVIIFLVIWEIASDLSLVNQSFIPAPSTVFFKLIAILLSGALISNVLISTERAAIGFFLSVIIGVPLGFMIGWNRTFERYVDPLLQTFRQLPVLGMFPVFILLFGVGEVSKIAMIFLGCVFAIFMNTTTGVLGVDPLLIKSARSMGSSDYDLFKKVILPGAIPEIMTGIRYAGTIAWLMLTAAEMVGASSGIAYYILNSQQRFDSPGIFAGIVTLTVLGLITNYALVYIEKKATSWKEEIVRG